MKINILSCRLTDAPFSKETKDAFVFEEDGQLEQLKLELQHARPGAYLISGYRGSGKTSFINRLKSEITGFLVVELNVAQKCDYPVLVKKIIRQLYLNYAKLTGDNIPKMEVGFNDIFKLLYDRTFYDIVDSRLSSIKAEQKSERKFQYDFRKLAPYGFAFLAVFGLAVFPGSVWFSYLILIASVIWAGVADVSKTWTATHTDTASAERSRKSLYDNEIAEYHLFEVLRQLHEQKVKVLLVFDELDKLPDDGQINDVINDLKPILLSGYASSLVVAGQSLFYELEKSTYLDDLVISTLFSKSIHIAFLKNAAIKKFCLGLISAGGDKSDPTVNAFFDSLILTSGRIPRKLVNLIRSAIVWEGSQATVVIEENMSTVLKWKASILQAVTYAIDNQLADQSKNSVQLDFFTAQVFIWIGKMMQYTSIPFKQPDIFKSEDYDDRYPLPYKSDLLVVWNALVDQLAEDNLLKISFGIDPEHPDDSYSWIIVSDNNGVLPSQELQKSPDIQQQIKEPEAITSSEPPVRLSPDELLEQEQIKQSLFLTDFAELEAYIRQLYLEVDLNTSHGNFGFPSLINKLEDLGVLQKGFHTTSRIRRLNETRNKLAHGQAIGTEDLDEVRSSTMNIGRIRAEINEAFTLFVIKNLLGDTNIEKSSKGGFDFIASSDAYRLAFEVKSTQKGKLTGADVAEFMDKYNNYVVTRKDLFEGSNFTGKFSNPLDYIIFFFQPPGRKSMDDIFINFKSTINAKMPQYAKHFHLHYISLTNTSKPIRKQIEEAVQPIIDSPTR